jgi:uncharacterized membrane protein YcfT
LHVFTPHTGVFIVDEFASRFVFFYAGYALAPQVFAFADRARTVPGLALAGALTVWAVFNAIAVNTGAAHLAGPDLAFSFIGIGAVIAFSVAITHRYAGQVLGYCGRNSIAVYLAFPLFMGPVRIVLLKLAGADAATAIAVASALAGVAGALAMQWALKGTRAGFLFARPAMFRLQPRRDGGPATATSPAVA